MIKPALQANLRLIMRVSSLERVKGVEPNILLFSKTIYLFKRTIHAVLSERGFLQKYSKMPCKLKKWVIKWVIKCPNKLNDPTWFASSRGVSGSVLYKHPQRRISPDGGATTCYGCMFVNRAFFRLCCSRSTSKSLKEMGFSCL